MGVDIPRPQAAGSHQNLIQMHKEGNRVSQSARIKEPCPFLSHTCYFTARANFLCPQYGRKWKDRATDTYNLPFRLLLSINQGQGVLVVACESRCSRHSRSLQLSHYPSTNKTHMHVQTTDYELDNCEFQMQAKCSYMLFKIDMVQLKTCIEIYDNNIKTLNYIENIIK